MNDMSEKLITGKFTLADGRIAFGSLHICGEASKLTLFDDEEFVPAAGVYDYIIGELHDGHLVSLLEGVLMRTRGTFSELGGAKHSAEVFPHYITLGPQHICASEPKVEQISFTMRDATAVFYDCDAFSTVIDTQPFISLLKEAAGKYRKVEFGEHPIIGYFTGKIDIAVVNTVLGEIRAEHRPSVTSRGPHGVKIANSVSLTLIPPCAITFEESMRQLSDLLRFFGLVIGREQSLSELTVALVGQSEQSSPLNIYRSYAPSQPLVDGSDSDRPHPAGVLVSTRNDSSQYSTVLQNYLDFDPERRDARARANNYLRSNRLYTIDRLIAAANVFDILCDTAYPDHASLSSELTEATDKARRLFRQLPESIERSAVLGALGRVGAMSLKNKIKYRVETAGLDSHFPKLLDVLKEAVNCRNHYVHGSAGRIDYSENFDIVCFFTDALEFSFSASDLIDTGWDIQTWMSGRPGGLHPFGVFAANYTENLVYFEQLMNVTNVPKSY